MKRLIPIIGLLILFSAILFSEDQVHIIPTNTIVRGWLYVKDSIMSGYTITANKADSLYSRGAYHYGNDFLRSDSIDTFTVIEGDTVITGFLNLNGNDTLMVIADKAFIDTNGVYKFYSKNSQFGGQANYISGSNYSILLSGYNDTITNSSYSAVVSGRKNKIKSAGSYNIIASGYNNTINTTQNYCGVFTGASNLISGASTAWSAIIGGYGNDINNYGQKTVIIAGDVCRTVNTVASLTGGYNNYVSGDYLFVFGATDTMMSNSYASAVISSDSSVAKKCSTSTILSSENGEIYYSNGSIIAGNGARCDTSNYSFVMNTQINKADSTFAFSKQSWIINGNDTTKIKGDSIFTSIVTATVNDPPTGKVVAGEFTVEYGDSAGSREVTAIEAVAQSRSRGTLIGLLAKGEADGDSVNNTTVIGGSFGTSACGGKHIGVNINATSNSNSDSSCYGIFSATVSAANTETYGAYFNVDNSATGIAYGVYADASDATEGYGGVFIPSVLVIDNDTTLITDTYVLTDSFVGEIDTTGTKFQTYVSNHTGASKYFDTLFIYGGADTNTTYLVGDTEITVYESNTKWFKDIDNFVVGNGISIGSGENYIVIGDSSYIINDAPFYRNNSIIAGVLDTIKNSTFSEIIGSYGSVIKDNNRCGIIFADSSSVSSYNGCIFGGRQNDITYGMEGVIVGGYNNQLGSATNVYKAGIFAGQNNTFNGAGTASVIIGGENNYLQGTNDGAILGGSSNKVGTSYAVIVGGMNDTIQNTSEYSVIAGGKYNVIDNYSYSSFAFGESNRISRNEHSFAGGQYSTIQSTPNSKGCNFAFNAEIDTCYGSFAFNCTLDKMDSTFAFNKQAYIGDPFFGPYTYITNRKVESGEVFRDSVFTGTISTGNTVDTLVNTKFTTTTVISLIFTTNPGGYYWITNAEDTVFVHVSNSAASDLNYRWWIIALQMPGGS